MTHRFTSFVVTVAVIASTACARAEPQQPETTERSKWPQTVDAAVDRLMCEVPAERKRDIRAMDKVALIDLHFGLGLYIRNEYGLWRGNRALLRATGQSHPDDASGIILEAFWERLRSGQR